MGYLANILKEKMATDSATKELDYNNLNMRCIEYLSPRGKCCK